MRRKDALLAVAKMTLEDRNETHGDPIAQFNTAQMLKDILRQVNGFHELNRVETEAAEFICTKLSRLAHGSKRVDPEKLADHWLDIIGYASIAVESRHVEDAALPPGIKEDDDASLIEIARKFAPRSAQERATRD